LEDNWRQADRLELARLGLAGLHPTSAHRGGDLLRLNGKDLQDLPLEERKAKLEALLKKPPGALRHSVSFTHKIEELLTRAQELGLKA
jgi:hypothetical protein